MARQYKIGQFMPIYQGIKNFQLSQHKNIMSPMDKTESHDFFVKLQARRRQHSVQSHQTKLTGRLLSGIDITCNPVKMATFPTIQQMFIDLNTSLPAGSAV